MSIRDKILEAAACVYARHGFKGATTRLIATEAGVNEVTIFRLFGSKQALIGAAVQSHSALESAQLPGEPTDPESEIATWCDAHLTALRANSALIRTTMAEIEGSGGAHPCMSEGHLHARRSLCAYVERMRERGLAHPDCDIDAAVAMLLGAIFADAMGREHMPTLYPQPADQAAARYTRCFLTAIAPRTGHDDSATPSAKHATANAR